MAGVVSASALAEDGTIWMTISDDEAYYLKVIADEVFVRKNFVADLFGQETHVRPMMRSGFKTGTITEHVLCYSKRKGLVDLTVGDQRGMKHTCLQRRKFSRQS